MVDDVGLAQRQCVPCRGGVAPLTADDTTCLLDQLNADWAVQETHHLHRTFSFENFADALVFTNRVGAIAEENGHHPDIYLTWGQVQIKIYTHKIDGLTESDFVLAAKLDAL